MKKEPLMNQVAAAIPSHVPPARVFDFDFVDDPLLRPDPHVGLLELGRRAPGIFFTPRYGGHWVVQSHEAIFHVAHDTDTFSSNTGASRVMLPISADPPEHRDYRSVLLQAFAPKNVNAMMPMIRETTVDLIDKVAGKGRCDFVADIAEPLPVIIFMRMLGLPVEKKAALRRLIIAVLAEGDAARRDDIFDEQLETILNPVIEARMAKREDDMISRILDARIGDRHPTFDEMQRYLLLLTNAGLDTVTNAMSFGLLHLARDTPLQEQLRRDRGLVPAVVEEFLRRYAVSSVLRRVARDAEYDGVHFKPGDRVHLLVPAANLDGKVFADPEKIILNREVPPVTFGTGIHRCLGSHLARLELRNLLVEWFDRIPAFQLDPERAPAIHAGLVYTVDQLPLVWSGEVGHA
jgi:cytochrome P450